MSSTARSLEREKAMEMVKKAGISTRRIIRILTSTEVRVRDRDRDKDSTAATVKGGIMAGVETESDVDCVIMKVREAIGARGQEHTNERRRHEIPGKLGQRRLMTVQPRGDELS
jgi:hypothetical protein